MGGVEKTARLSRSPQKITSIMLERQEPGLTLAAIKVFREVRQEHSRQSQDADTKIFECRFSLNVTLEYFINAILLIFTVCLGGRETQSKRGIVCLSQPKLGAP